MSNQMKIDKTHIPESTSNGVGRLNKFAYRDGYIYDRNLEDNLQQSPDSDRNTIRKPNKATGGFRLGIAITVLTALIGGTFFLLMQPEQPSSPSGQSSPPPKSSQSY
jgi:hypothetical protein